MLATASAVTSTTPQWLLSRGVEKRISRHASNALPRDEVQPFVGGGLGLVIVKLTTPAVVRWDEHSDTCTAVLLLDRPGAMNVPAVGYVFPHP